MVTTDLHADDPGSSGSTDIVKGSLQAAFNLVEEACSRNPDRRASQSSHNFIEYLKVGHLSRAGEDPPRTKEGILPTIPSKGFLKQSYTRSRPWSSERSEDEHQAFRALWLHCHPKSEPWNMTTADKNASQRQDDYTRCRYEAGDEKYPHPETWNEGPLILSDPPGLDFYQPHRSCTLPSLRPEDEPHLQSVLWPEHEERIRTASRSLLSNLKDLGVQEPEATWLQVYFPLAHKHRAGFTIATHVPRCYQVQYLKTTKPSTLQEIGSRFRGSAPDSMEAELARAADILYEHLTGRSVSAQTNQE